MDCHLRRRGIRLPPCCLRGARCAAPLGVSRPLIILIQLRRRYEPHHVLHPARFEPHVDANVLHRWVGSYITLTLAKRPVLALVDILALTATVWKMTANMSEIGTRVSTTWFLAPYCAWLGYATYLNAGLVYLNWVGTNRVIKLMAGSRQAKDELVMMHVCETRCRTDRPS